MPTWAIIAIAGGALLLVGIIVVALAFRRPEAPPRQCMQCGRPMAPDWPQCMFCGWRPLPPAALVEFLSGPMAGQQLVLEMDVTTIGSIGGNTIVLADPAVSRKHAGIRRTGPGYELADLGSTNGVYVNGQRTARHDLRPGDVIRVGTSEMIFRVTGR
jgi:hypothetical protein